MNKKIVGSILVLSILISGIPALSQTDDAGKEIITSKVMFTEPEIKKIDEYVSININEATSMTSEASNPILPIITKTYTFPFGTTINDVKIDFSNPSTMKLSSDILPALPAQYIATQYQQDSNERERNEEVYSSNNAYPKESWSIRYGAGLDGVNHVIYVSIHLCPIVYYPLDNDIDIFSEATIDITYTNPEHPVQFPDVYDLLIVSPSEFSLALQPLIDAKEATGLKTNLINLEDIPQVGLDRQEDVKYYIKGAIDSWGITYVMLIGNGLKDEEKFPVRYAWVPSGTYEKNFPSDLYYADVFNADLSFSSWDNDSDGKYAEFPQDNEAVDLFPDVYLSRIPCTTVEEVDTVVDKIITYMDSNQMNNKILQIGGDTFPNDPEKVNEGEYANNEVMKYLDEYTSTQIWGSKGNLKRYRILLEMHKGFDFVDFSGHGSYASWATHPPNDESVWLPKGIGYNGFTYIEPQYYLFNFWKLPVVVFNACSCSKFSEFDSCLSWSFIKKPMGGAIASFGASGIGYGSYGTHEIERLFGWMEVHLFKELVETKILGEVWGTCLNEYIIGFELEDADYKTIYEMALFGDPSLVIDNA
jgi:peptidase C25-like protein